MFKFAIVFLCGLIALLSFYLLQNKESFQSVYADEQSTVQVAVLNEGVQIYSKEIFSTDIAKSAQDISSQINLIRANEDRKSVVDNKIVNCETKSSLEFIGLDQIESLISERFISGNVIIQFDELLNKRRINQIDNLCDKYLAEAPFVEEKLIEAYGLPGNTIYQNIYLASNGQWQVKDENKLRTVFLGLKEDTQQMVSDGKYLMLDGKVAVLEDYRLGKTLNIGESLNNFYGWLDSPIEKEPRLIFFTYKPSFLASGRDVLDFTKVMGFGQTRIDLVKNGVPNAAVHFAELGLEEMHNTIVYPGEEFSFLDEVDKQPGISVAASGRLIGNGYCNSTTTLFRALLHSGLKITDRASHGALVSSYEWGPYPYNIVDSTFYATEGLEVDLKFVNNYDFPLLIQFDTQEGGDGYQYHTVYIRSSKEAPTRNVELHDWMVWNRQSETHFDGSFRRTVVEDGRIILQDEFYSRYR